MTDADLVHTAIALSGLSARRFAMEILARDERTVRLWLAGQPIPPKARDWLLRWLSLSDRTRAVIVKAFAV